MISVRIASWTADVWLACELCEHSLVGLLQTIREPLVGLLQTIREPLVGLLQGLGEAHLGETSGRAQGALERAEELVAMRAAQLVAQNGKRSTARRAR